MDAFALKLFIRISILMIVGFACQKPKQRTYQSFNFKHLSHQDHRHDYQFLYCNCDSYYPLKKTKTAVILKEDTLNWCVCTQDSAICLYTKFIYEDRYFSVDTIFDSYDQKIMELLKLRQIQPSSEPYLHKNTTIKSFIDILNQRVSNLQSLPQKDRALEYLSYNFSSMFYKRNLYHFEERNEYFLDCWHMNHKDFAGSGHGNDNKTFLLMDIRKLSDSLYIESGLSAIHFRTDSTDYPLSIRFDLVKFRRTRGVDSLGIGHCSYCPENMIYNIQRYPLQIYGLKKFPEYYYKENKLFIDLKEYSEIEFEKIKVIDGYGWIWGTTLNMEYQIDSLNKMIIVSEQKTVFR